ncbi:MAG TPA: septum formation initiator family protein [Termitinemataceae bacterium]|nr:septum formation initiator family protein [Termitinemataceae bacterium]HPQ00925.1 septum formation initiator family protein [Termitinemataceae bacterium]
MMHHLRMPILMAIWVTVSSYTALSYFWGPNGEKAMNYLWEQKKLLEKNIEELSVNRDFLQQRVLALLYDAETLQEYARSLGYGQGNERFIRIQGKGPLQMQSYPIGALIQVQPPITFSHEQIFLISCGIGFVSFVILFFFSVVFQERKASRR